jgi:hypothetical protein
MSFTDEDLKRWGGWRHDATGGLVMLDKDQVRALLTRLEAAEYAVTRLHESWSLPDYARLPDKQGIDAAVDNWRKTAGK